MSRFQRYAVSLLAGFAILFAVTSSVAPAHAAGRLVYRYQRGYYLDHGWLCYGWPSGVYHCTAHWRRVGGKFVSLNPAWVPSQSTRVVRRAAPPAPKPPVVVGDGSAPSGSVRADIVAAFGPYAAQATRVAMCESSLNPSAHNPSGASGLFQFLPSTWAETPWRSYSPYNAWAAANAAHWLFVRDGYSFREWTCSRIVGVR